MSPILLLLAAPAIAASPSWFGAPVTVTPAGDLGADVKTGDFNGDGLPDISVSAAVDGSWVDADRAFNLELSLSDGAGGFSFVSVPTTLLSGYTLVTDVADLDGDGDADLVGGHSAGFSVFFSDGSTLATEVDYAGERVGPVELGDVDDDGDVDLLTLDDLGQLNVYTNDGAGGFTLAQALPTNADVVYDSDWDSIDLVDLNHDGALDVVMTLADLIGTGFDPLVVFLGDGSGGLDTTAWTTTMGLPYVSAVYDLDVGDIDGDGLTDLVFAADEYGVASIPWDGGFGSTSVWPISTYAYNWVLTGDIDGDGDTDVVGTVGFDLGVLVQDAGTLTDPGVSLPLQTTCGWAVADDGIELVDMNGDGCDDVVAHRYGLGVTILPATATGCTGAAPTPWGGSGTDTGTDTGTLDTGTLDTGTLDTGTLDTGTLDTGSADTGADEGVDTSGDPEVDPFMACSVVSPRSGSLLLLALAGLGLARRRR